MPDPAQAPREPDVLILGGGRFGLLAAKRLGSRAALVVEPNPGPDLSGCGAPVLRQEGVAAAVEILAGDDSPAWVVPALPVHFLAEWLRACLADLSSRPVDTPRESLPDAALIMSGEEGKWYLSLADFMCPDDCPEPAQVCTATGTLRGEPMFSRLAGMSRSGFQTAVLRSRQLAPGVGGLRRDEMTELRDLIAGQGGNWIIGTACKCHGVVQAIEWDSGGKDGAD